MSPHPTVLVVPASVRARGRTRLVVPLLAACLVGVGLPVAAAAQPTGSSAPGVVASWTFREGHGRIVHETSGHTALDLVVHGRARWTAGGLRLRRGTSLESRGAANRLLRQAGRGGGLSVEAWVSPGRAVADDASLVRLSGPTAGQRHVLLRSAGGAGHVRHLLWSRRSGGAWDLFVDGRRQLSGRWQHFVRPGRGGRVVLGGPGWSGELRAVTVYARAFTRAEITFNKRRIRSTTTSSPTASAAPTSASPTPTASPSPLAPVSASASPSPTGPTPPLLLKHGWDMPSPSYVRDHITAMDAMPFDGLTISIPGLGDKVQRQAPVSYDQFRLALAPLVGLRAARLTHNYVTAYATPAGSVFGDWSVPIANFANLARAGGGAGVEGIFFDNEGYFGSVYDFPGDCPGHTLAQCQDQMRLRGRQVMDAMRAVWPNVRVMTAYGPWVSDPATAQALSPYLPYNDISFANELMGPFVVGMAESAAGTSATIVDGGEIYTPRSTLQFDKVASWSTTGMAASSLVPGSLAAGWASTVSPGVAVYDQPWLGLAMDRATFAATVHNALQSTASVVWVYTERYDWWGSGWPTTPVPSDWVSAVATARG